MKTQHLLLGVLAVFGLVFSGCILDRTPVGPADSTIPGDPKESRIPQTEAVGPAWESYIISEAYYALCQQRTGTSHLVYNPGGYAMGDWDYPHSDAYALNRLIVNYGSDTGPLGLWQSRYRQGGWCKFFVDTVLYRSSYGYPNGHLFLPSGYVFSPAHGVSEAQPGWILQAPAPKMHTAIVVARVSTGLDVIDANAIGTTRRADGSWAYSYAIGRHVIPWQALGDNRYAAYRAHEICRLVQ